MRADIANKYYFRGSLFIVAQKKAPPITEGAFGRNVIFLKEYS